MGYASRNNPMSIALKNREIITHDKAAERLEYLLHMGLLQIAYEEDLITYDKLVEFKLAKRHNDSI